MEGLIFILFFAFIAFSIFNSASKSSKSQAGKGLKPNGDYDIPEALQAKWNAERKTRSSDKTPTQRGQASLASKSQNIGTRSAVQGTQAVLKRANRSKQNRRQSKDARSRNTAQRKELSRSGNGAPEDKNHNRRDDWGRRGAMGAGWVGPIFVSALIAGGIATLFATG